MHIRTIPAAVIAVAALVACIEPIEPKMTLTANDQELTSIAENCKGADFSLGSGQAFYLHHALPEGVVPPEPLQIEIETACGSFPRAIELDDLSKPLRIPLEAPVGSECGVTVTATIANSSIRCELPAMTEMDCDAQCPEVDATEGSEGSTT